MGVTRGLAEVGTVASAEAVDCSDLAAVGKAQWSATTSMFQPEMTKVSAATNRSIKLNVRREIRSFKTHVLHPSG